MKPISTPRLIFTTQAKRSTAFVVLSLGLFAPTSCMLRTALHFDRSTKGNQLKLIYSAARRLGIIAARAGVWPFWPMKLDASHMTRINPASVSIVMLDHLHVWAAK